MRFVVSVSEAISLSTTVEADTEVQAEEIGKRLLNAELDYLLSQSDMASTGTGWDDPISVELETENE